MPPLLTIVLFIWAWSMIDGYVLQPLENGLNFTIRRSTMKVENGIPTDISLDSIFASKNGQRVPVSDLLKQPITRSEIQAQLESQQATLVRFVKESVSYVPLSNGQWIPNYVFDDVQSDPGSVTLSTATASTIYHRYVELNYLPRWRGIPVFLILFVSALYFLGKFIAFGAGRFVLRSLESIIQRLPLIRNVYSSVKQVTDFVFSEQELEFTRVVALQYPRTGIWSIGFVTGESMLEIHSSANEPVVTVLIPTSPMPATGYTITIRRSETIDLDLSIDEAIQFIVSCGVVIPPHQMVNERPRVNPSPAPTSVDSSWRPDSEPPHSGDSALAGPTPEESE